MRAQRGSEWPHYQGPMVQHACEQRGSFQGRGLLAGLGLLVWGIVREREPRNGHGGAFLAWVAPQRGARLGGPGQGLEMQGPWG